MERISDLSGVGQHRVERQPPRPRQVQHRPQDLITPLFGLLSEPCAGAGGGASLDHIEELAGTHVDDRRGPRLGPPLSLPGEQHLT